MESGAISLSSEPKSDPRPAVLPSPKKPPRILARQDEGLSRRMTMTKLEQIRSFFHEDIPYFIQKFSNVSIDVASTGSEYNGGNVEADTARLSTVSTDNTFDSSTDITDIDSAKTPAEEAFERWHSIYIKPKKSASSKVRRSYSRRDSGNGSAFPSTRQTTQNKGSGLSEFESDLSELESDSDSGVVRVRRKGNRQQSQSFIQFDTDGVRLYRVRRPLDQDSDDEAEEKESVSGPASLSIERNTSEEYKESAFNVDPATSDIGGGPSAEEPKRRKKKFLKCGLYSLDNKYESGELEKPVIKRGRTEFVTIRADQIFPLPMHYGMWFLDNETDFELPFDIMYGYENGAWSRMLQPDPWVKVSKNIYVERKERKASDPAVCNCPLPKEIPEGMLGCGEDCLNRCMFMECDPNSCPWGERCSNQRFQKKDEIKELEVFHTGSRGFGLRTTVHIPRGAFVIEYRGEVISNETSIERMETAYKNKKHFYFLDIGNGEVIDGSKKGTEARFVNHSCDPNCHVEKWKVGGEFRIGLFASRDISPGAELLYDYNFETFSGENQQICRCGSVNCRGLIGAKKVTEQKEAERKLRERRTQKNKKKPKKKKKRGTTEEKEPVVEEFFLLARRGRSHRGPGKELFKKAEIVRARNIFLLRNAGSANLQIVKSREKSTGALANFIQNIWRRKMGCDMENEITWLTTNDNSTKTTLALSTLERVTDDENRTRATGELNPSNRSAETAADSEERNTTRKSVGTRSTRRSARHATAVEDGSPRGQLNDMLPNAGRKSGPSFAQNRRSIEVLVSKRSQKASRNLQSDGLSHPITGSVAFPPSPGKASEIVGDHIAPTIHSSKTHHRLLPSPKSSFSKSASQVDENNENQSPTTIAGSGYVAGRRSTRSCKSTPFSTEAQKGSKNGAIGSSKRKSAAYAEESTGIGEGRITLISKAGKRRRTRA